MHQLVGGSEAIRGGWCSQNESEVCLSTAVRCASTASRPAGLETIVQFVQAMIWKDRPPVVRLLTTTSGIGVCLTKQAMAQVATHVERLTGLERWFVEISCAMPASPDT